MDSCEQASVHTPADPEDPPSLALARLEEADLRTIPPGITHLELEAEAVFGQTPRARARWVAQATKQDLIIIPRLNLRLLSPESAEDQLQELLELFDGRVEFVLFASGKKQFEPEQWARFRAVRERAQQSGIRVFYEWSRADTLLTTRALHSGREPVGSVVDLDHHWRFVPKIPRLSLGSSSIHFKLHGWHPDRWMRRYGRVLGSTLLGRARKIKSSILILAHSGRGAEARDFVLWRSS